MKINTAPKNFSDLKQNLELCEELFLQHQIQLMHKNVERALAIFEQLTEIRKCHLAVMDEILLPAFRKSFNQFPEGAKPLFFEREKKQILKFLDKYIRKLGNIFLHSDKLEIVELFEEYAWLKDLLDHHDAREKAFLFAILDEKLAEPKKRELLNAITKKLSVLERGFK